MHETIRPPSPRILTEPVDSQVSPPHGDAEEILQSTIWQAEWGGNIMDSRGHMHQVTELKPPVSRVGGDHMAAATYRPDDKAGCELMSINATRPGGGIGSKLLATIDGEAREAGCRRLWLITSNDTLDALRFYQRQGYRITAM